MRTITLELLRHGPPHNQLLSPLTRYLALCGNHPAVTVELPFEHAQFMTRLRALNYRDTDVTREMQLRDTAQVIADILGSVRGLAAELADYPGREDGVTHLRLVLSSSELALLPFELANAPEGFPSAGQPLFLQSQVPLCLTREVRRVTYEQTVWPSRPRILFAWASPPGYAPVPAEAHLLALRRVIEPWVYHYDDEEERLEVVGRHLTVLPRASADDLQRACASGRYTHLHLLAHGVEGEQAEDRRYFLALHDGRDPSKSDPVDGSRLAALIRTVVSDGDRVLFRPMVVSLASCRGGDVGSVVGAGASLAHSLHENGIPFVAASQFPLSFAGSVLLAEILYAGLLWGADPRLVVSDLRRQLKSRLGTGHDWASLVAYAALPEDLPHQLLRVAFEQAEESIFAALNHADKLVSRMWTKASQSPTQPQRSRSQFDPNLEFEEVNRKLEERFHKLDAAQDRLRRLLDRGYRQRAQIFGRLASTEKRMAEIHLTTAGYFTKIVDQIKEDFRQRALSSLERSRRHYLSAFDADREESWAIVQALVLAAALKDGAAIDHDLWELARLLSLQDLKERDSRRVAWAYANLIELDLMRALFPGPELVPMDTTLGYAKALVEVAGDDSGDVHAARRQILRYIEFFPNVNPALPWPLGEAEQLYDLFPETPHYA